MTLFLVGGGPAANLSDVHDAYAASVGARARGHAARVAYISHGLPEQVSQFAPGYVEPLTSRLPECSVTEIYLLPPAEDGTDPTTWPDDLADYDGIIVAGGHTPSYLTGLAPRRDQLARLVREDVPWIGYSAGAMVASRHALIGGWRQNGRAIGNQAWSEDLDEITVVDGLALVSPLIATHNDVAQSDSVVLALMEADPSLRTAVAMDEDTCLIVDPITGRTAHYGRGRLRWFSREAGAIVVKTQYPEG